ncbi:MAG: Hsp20/alpha crystallin family protein [Lachnospiraceae bacterium]|nr:Hsp20/alpha crystallin family protein [Lachnospiraceae bacterium]
MSYNPFREMEEFEKRFFGTPFTSFFNSRDIGEFKTDISEHGDNYLLEADLPGFDKKDIHLEITDNTLTINAERNSEHDEKDDNKYIRIERSYGKYSRQFDISSIDSDKITAKYDNGVLKLTLPKKQDVTPETKRLEIE